MKKYSMHEIDLMDGHEFEYFCAELLENSGYEKTEVTPGSGDQGIDVIAYKDGIKFGIQCKCYASDIGNKAVQEAYSGKEFYNCHIGAVLSNRYFTSSAIELASKNRILLWDREYLINLLQRADLYAENDSVEEKTTEEDTSENHIPVTEATNLDQEDTLPLFFTEEDTAENNLDSEDPLLIPEEDKRYDVILRITNRLIFNSESIKTLASIVGMTESEAYVKTCNSPSIIAVNISEDEAEKIKQDIRDNLWNSASAYIQENHNPYQELFSEDEQRLIAEENTRYDVLLSVDDKDILNNIKRKQRTAHTIALLTGVPEGIAITKVSRSPSIIAVRVYKHEAESIVRCINNDRMNGCSAYMQRNYKTDQEIQEEEEQKWRNAVKSWGRGSLIMLGLSVLFAFLTILCWKSSVNGDLGILIVLFAVLTLGSIWLLFLSIDGYSNANEKVNAFDKCRDSKK